MGYSKGVEWTEKLIEEGIRECVKTLGLSRMPTNKECVQSYGGHGLSVKISRTFGFEGWAEKLNLPMKESCSTRGWRYEGICVCDIHTFLGREGELTSVKSPSDVIVDGVRIDVKMSSLFHSSTQNTSYYSFNIHNINCGADFYIFYCVDNGEIQKTYVIPQRLMNSKNQFSIGVRKSKYDKYLNRWDLIDSYIENMEKWIQTIE